MPITPTAPAKNPFVTIAGNPVSPETSPLATAPYADVLRKTLGTDLIEAYSRDTKRLVVSEMTAYAHSFIAAAQMAYAGHYPLVLSPDIIWLLIAQGFAIHLRENADALQHRFFAREGKLEIDFCEGEFLAGFENGNGETIFRKLSEQIQEQAGPKAYAFIIPSFSTTGTTEKVAFDTALADAPRDFVGIAMEFNPGIPSFYLEGTPDDWRWIRAHAEALREYDIKWWMYDLLPALDEFVAASEGNANTTFWQNFYRERKVERYEYIEGRFLRFFPYIPQFRREEYSDMDDATHQKYEIFEEQVGIVNYELRESAQKELAGISDMDIYDKLLQYLRGKMHLDLIRSKVEISRRLGMTEVFDFYFDRNPMVQQPVREGSWSGKLTSDALFPSGLCKLPVTLRTDVHEYQIELAAGFVGVSQDESTLALHPEIGWAIVGDKRRAGLEELAALTQQIGLNY